MYKLNLKYLISQRALDYHRNTDICSSFKLDSTLQHTKLHQMKYMQHIWRKCLPELACQYQPHRRQDMGQS